MAIGNGRTDPAKEQILARYSLQPVIYTRLLNGKAITCCCGDTVGQLYYKFDALDKVTNTSDVLYAGKGCAGRFFELEPSLTRLALFDPLQAPPRLEQGHGHGGAAGGHVPPGDPLNAEIHDAIHLTLICWGAQPMSGTVLSKLLEEVRQFPHRPLYDRKVKSVNTVIGAGGRTLTAMLAALRVDNPMLRHYQFPLMQAALQRLGVQAVWL